MTNKKKLLIGVSSIVVIIIGICSYFWFNKDNNTQVYKNKNEETKEEIVESNWLSMMYETGPGTGEYTESKSSLWPEDGYIFNENLSSCENGGELSWNEELKAVTLHSNKSDSCYVYFDVYIIPVINSVITSNIEIDSITLTVNVTNGNNPVTTYYYSNNNGNSYVSSASNTYTFSGLNMGTEYDFSVYVEDSAGYKSEVYTLSETTALTLADNCRKTGSNTLACYVATQYTGIDGENSLYYYSSGEYRYRGANPNNYVCFGSDAIPCPNDNLYRIIGVFGLEVKLIKADVPSISQTGTDGTYFDAYTNYYNDAYTSAYKGSMNLSNVGMYTRELNESANSDILFDINLNTRFLNIFDLTWQNKISTHQWTMSDIISSGKIGLMSLDDYNLGKIGSDVNTNWLYLGIDEWTTYNIYYTGTIVYTGYVGAGGSIVVRESNGALSAVRPSFYLTSDIQYISGSGTSTDPIRID